MNRRKRQGIDERAKSEVTRDGHLAVLADHSSVVSIINKELTERWGSDTQATHCSEGEAGHNVLMEGKMGDTQKSQTITTKLHQIAKQAREYPERVFISLESCLAG